MRCIVVGASNLSTEAAHEAGMQSLSVAGRHPVYELTAADLVVSNLGDVTMMNLKQLFASEKGVAWQVGGRPGLARAPEGCSRWQPISRAGQRFEFGGL